MTKLSILIPSLVSRERHLAKLLFKLQWQKKALSNPDDVDIVMYVDNGEQTIGFKRNHVMSLATGEYQAFIDDDDDVTDNYLQLLLNGIATGADCCSLTGLYIPNGVLDMPFIHSIKYDKAWQDDKFYYRAPNHLNCIKRDLVKDIKFQEKNFGEDGCWMEDIFNQKRLKSEHYIPQLLYYYNFVSR
jgi:glycosyltransferase involved in cell wall biosynthesis